MSEAIGAVEFTKPGQKLPTTSPGSGDRVFYESLYRENPSSEMALRWCIEHGVFNEPELTPAYKRYVEIISRVKDMKVATVSVPRTTVPDVVTARRK